MIARFNIFALLLGLLILTIASVPGVFHAELLFATHDDATHDQHRHHADKATLTSSYTEHAMARMSGHDHGSHNNEQSCWDHCADILDTTLRVASPRTSEPALSPSKERRDFFDSVSVVPASLSASFASREPAFVFQDHRIGVSRILRTSMRLRN